LQISTFYIGEDKGQSIAICYGVSNSEEAEANAHLIAAAPELLEACKKILGSINANCICEQLHKDDAELLSELMAQTYKAINKAEGN